ncbi:hypothetical protein COTS27_00269 [Spirochaetota bacterium]|nr:hypothetical protein COTS27_00269 [Spirochaetota bacterium]
MRYFLDEDGNGELKVNFLGIPVEKTGFSKRNPRLGHPNFEDVQVNAGKNEVVTVEQVIK